MTDSFEMITISNTYEAAFYILYGAEVIEVTVRPLRENKQRKEGRRRTCVFTLSHVPSWAVEMWHNNSCYGNIQEYVSARMKLKELIFKHLHPKIAVDK